MTSPDSPLRPLRRQVDAVRRRRNLHTAQDALAMWVTAAAAAAIGVVLSAVRGGRTAFMAALLCAALMVAAATALLGRRVARRWLSAADAPRWVDAARGLRGRLPSLLELDGRARGGFFELLVAQGLDTRARWRPEDVVPEVVPARTFALAVIACSLLALAVALAPKLRPAPPRLVVGERRMDFVRTDEAARAERLLVTPGREQPAPRSDGTAAPEAEPPGALAQASDAVQNWLRETLGVAEDWEAGPETTTAGPPSGETRTAREPPRGARPGAAADPHGGAGAPTRDTDGDAVRRADADAGGQTGAREPGGGGPGAGDGSDPALYGEPHDEGDGGADRFELAIAARVRTRRGSAMAPWTTTPGSGVDRNPALAARQLAEQPGHRMPVSSSFAPIVRRVYTHAPAPAEDAR